MSDANGDDGEGDDADRPFDGDPSWRVTRTAKDGTVFSVRPIVPSDREELRQAYRAASARTRYLRFLGSFGELNEETLTYLTDVDQENHVALVATVVSPDLKTERGIGVARFIRLASDPKVAEAAISVADDMQRRGIGSVLAQEIERAARHRGVRTIRADVLEGNAAMRSILEDAGAKRVDSGDNQGTLSYDIELEPEAAPTKSLVEILRGTAQAMSSVFRSATSATTTTRGDEAERDETER